MRPKSFAVLQYLAEHPGQILSKQEILSAVWFGVRVDHAALKVCIREVRERLGEDPHAPRLIATVHRHGYRFIGQVQREEMPDLPGSAGSVGPSPMRPMAESVPVVEPAAYARAAPPVTPGAFPQPPGVAFSPSWYVPREQEERLAMGYLEVPGATALVLGPERFGKTWLLKSLLGQLRYQDPRSQVIEINLSYIDEQSRASLPAYLRALTRRIAAQAGGGTPEDDMGGPSGDPLERLTHFMEQALRRAPDRLVLALDSADAIFACPFGEDVLGLLRLWAELAAAEPWSRLRLVLAISTTATIFAGGKDPAAPSHTAPIWLTELRDHQVRQLAERHGLFWRPDECRAAAHLLGGHPYLLRLLIHGVACRQVALADVLAQRGYALALFDDYLQGLRRRLERHPELVEALRAPEAGAGRESSLYALYQAGLLRQVDGDGYVLRCPLYARILGPRPAGRTS